MRLLQAATILSAVLFAAPVVAQPVAGALPAKCFFVGQFENWKAPDTHTIFVKVVPGRYFRLDLSGACSGLKWPTAFLVTRFHGTTSVCSALDWDIHVSTSPHGIRQACIVKSMRELTPAEVTAIPRRFKP